MCLRPGDQCDGPHVLQIMGLSGDGGTPGIVAESGPRGCTPREALVRRDSGRGGRH